MNLNSGNTTLTCMKGSEKKAKEMNASESGGGEIPTYLTT